MRRTSILALLLGLLGLALLQGCNGSDDPGTNPPSSSSTSSGSGSPSTAASSPTADVATGIELSLANSSVTAPEKWTEGKDLTRYEVSADSPDHFSYITLGEINAFGSTIDAEQLGKNRLSSNVYPKKPELLPVTELDGQEVYHVRGMVTSEQYIEEFGAIANDRIVTLTFSFNRRVPQSERDAVVASVLPTFQWK